MSAERLPITDDEPTIRIEDRPIIVDRSTLEPYIDCPLGARLKESLVKSAGLIAASGSESHKAISAAIADYVSSHLSADGKEPPMGIRDLKESIERYLWNSRADVQPDVIDSCKYAAYKIAEYIAYSSDGTTGIHPLNILAFDGGEGISVREAKKDELGEIVLNEAGRATFEERSLSGQLHLDFTHGHQTVRLTCEVDLLHSTRTPKLLRMIDWKTGYAKWTEAAIQSSFQLGTFYPLLALETYQDAEAVDVVVCNTRQGGNGWTMPVRFFRHDVGRLRRRVQTAIDAFMLNRSLPLHQVAATPSREACRLCDAAALCSVCDEDIREIKKDPVAATDKLYALTRAIEEIESTLKTCCKGGDIVTPSGNAFGYQKPKRETKPTAKFYQSKSASSSDDEEA